MNTTTALRPPGTQKQPQNNLASLANAMRETENSSYTKTPQTSSSSTSLLSEAMARTGGHLPQDFGNNDFNLQDYQDHQAKLMEEQEKKRLHKELHDRVNPVELHDVFKAGSERTKKDLEEVRRNIELLIKEITFFAQEVDIAISQNIGDQGHEGGKGFKHYLLKIQAFVMLLRQKVHSARTWQQTAQNKKAQQQSRKGPGAMLAGQHGHSETKAIFDTMHHERATAFGGG